MTIHISDKFLGDIIDNMDWMIKDLDYKNKLNEQPEDSPEMKKAKWVLDVLKKAPRSEQKFVQNEGDNHDG